MLDEERQLLSFWVLVYTAALAVALASCSARASAAFELRLTTVSGFCSELDTIGPAEGPKPTLPNSQVLRVSEFRCQQAPPASDR
jgi:hypothetical protein